MLSTTAGPSSISAGPQLQLPSLAPVIPVGFGTPVKSKKAAAAQDKSDRLTEEAVYPPGVLSDMQKHLENNTDLSFIGKDDNYFTVLYIVSCVLYCSGEEKNIIYFISMFLIVKNIVNNLKKKLSAMEHKSR